MPQLILIFNQSCVSGCLPLFYSLWSYISLHIICYIWDLTTDHIISTNCNQTLGCYANRAVENSNLFRKIAQNTTEKDISTTG